MSQAMEPPRTAITRLLREWSAGRREALDELFPLLYGELRRLAASYLRREHGPRSLQATALVNELYLKLVHQNGLRADTRAQFFGIAARTMRALLVDRARARNAAKRGGRHADVLPNVEGTTLPPDIDLLAIDEALTRLAARDAYQAHLVELRFFAGLTIDDVARVLKVSPATVSREWTHARAWLYAELKGATP
jgi:RNA polymerase sigma factor (TIGR02999 family)